MGFTNIKLFLKNRSAAVQFTLKSSTTSLLKKDWRDPLMLIYTDLKISKGNPSPAKWVAFNVLLSQFLPLNASQTFYILRGNRHRIGNMTDSHLYISIQQSKHVQQDSEFESTQIINLEFSCLIQTLILMASVLNSYSKTNL